MDVRRFKSDLYELADRACAGDDPQIRAKVLAIADILVMLYKKNLVKINHSALELVCAHDLVKQGYDVKVEHRLDKTLVCDVMGTRGDGQLIVEIETGFIPPEAALEPSSYARGRIASKVARYSRFAGKFALGTTPSYIMDLPEFFVTPPRSRTSEQALKIKAMTDVRYNKPPISLEEIVQSRLHAIFIIDVDTGRTEEIDPETYVERTTSLIDWHGNGQGLNPD